MMERAAAASIEQELADTIKTVYSETIHFGRTQDEHIARMQELVWKSRKFSILPTWAKSALHGADAVYRRFLYEASLTGEKPPLMALTHSGERVITLEDVHEMSHEERAKVHTRHVWRSFKAKGELKYW